jgi:outer membrane lipoprotein-sorting protein
MVGSSSLSLVLCVPLALAPQAPSGQAASQTRVPDLNAIVASMEAASQQNPAKARAYTVTRSYKLFHGEERQPGSETTAEVTFAPPSTKKYEIKQSSGISRGQQMVRDILDLESVPAQSTSDISHNNYDFVFLQQEKLGDIPTYLLRMIPKRKEKDLLNGLVWVDTRTLRIQRIEGTPTKKPSWWIRSLYITLQYTALHGLRLPTYMRAGATVRVAGSYLLTGEDVALQLSFSATTTGSESQRDSSSVPVRG